MKIFAIDPGNIESAYAVIEMPDFRLLDFGKVKNEELLQMLISYQFVGWENIERDFTFDKVAVEMVASYGMAVGKSVFDTCVWIGRFVQALEIEDVYDLSDFVYRIEEKMCLCKDSRAKDSNIRQALIDRYAKHDFKNGRGVKKNPDTFYGVAKDVWSAIAVGVTYYEKTVEGRC